MRLVAAVATLLASAAGAEIRYLPLATFAAGDKPSDVASYSEVVLTEYRFQCGGHVAAVRLVAEHLRRRRRLVCDIVYNLVELADGNYTQAEFDEYLALRGGWK